MSSNLLTLKEFNIDYSFIIKNYLNPELWQKTWTLFIYKGFKFTLKLDRISCSDNKIVFEIILEDVLNPNDYRESWSSYPNRTVTELLFSLKIDNINFLKRKINSKMAELVVNLEARKCKASDEYIEIEYGEDKEIEILKQVAEEFLDENQVSNEEIREVYIDNYIDNNRKSDELKKNLIEANEYRLLTDLHLLLAKINDDEYTIRKINNKLSSNECNEALERIKKYLEDLETEEYQEELKENLEEL